MKIFSKVRVFVVAVAMLVGLAAFTTTGPAAPAAARTPVLAAVTSGDLILINADGRVEHFGIGSDCHLWHRWQSIVGGPLGGKVSLNGPCLIDTYGIDGAANQDGRLEVFGIDQNYNLVHAYQNSGSPGGWAWGPSLGSPADSLRNGPTVGKQSNGALIVYSNTYYGTRVYRYQRSPNCCWDPEGWVPTS